MWRRTAALLAVTTSLAACGQITAPGGTASTSTPSPSGSPAEPAASVAELTSLGERMVPRHPQYGYYVSCVNFKENGAWPPPPQPVDYSACPITDELSDRMQATRADFYETQNPASGRTVAVTPQPGGGVIVVTLAYAPVVRVELVAVRTSRGYLVGDVVAKGDVTGAAPPPLTFSEKPAAPSPPASPATAAPGRSRVLDVPWYRQVFGLSCEEASLRMALAYQRIATTDAAILDIIGRDERPAYVENGVMRWGNPYATFVGNPNGSEVALTGYGTYYPTIARAATRLGGHVLRAGEGVRPAEVYDAILAGHPAVVWVTYRWVAATRVDYVAFDGQRVPYAGPVEHAVIAVGVDPARVLINDPLLGVVWLQRDLFERTYATYNDMAVILA